MKRTCCRWHVPMRRTLAVLAGSAVLALGGCGMSRTVIVENNSDEPVVAEFFDQYQAGPTRWMRASIAPGSSFEYSLRDGPSSRGTVLEVRPANKALVEPLKLVVPENDTTRVKVIRQPEQFQLQRVN